MNVYITTDVPATKAMESHASPFSTREGLPEGVGKEREYVRGAGPAKALGEGSSSPGAGLSLWESPLPVCPSGLQRAAGGKCLSKFFPQAKGWPGARGSIPSSRYLPELGGSRIWTLQVPSGLSFWT